MTTSNTRDVATRLREARKSAGFRSAADAARNFGWEVPTYSSHENGSRGIPYKKVKAYADALKADVQWILEGNGDTHNPVATHLTHLDKKGRARMVDVSAKDTTARTATATGRITMERETFKLIKKGAVKKGDVLSIARLAGIMGAKKTPELIPLCHPLALSSVVVDLTLQDGKPPAVEITATCKLKGQTGVEMEALTAVAVAALTVYDMCKAVDRAMTIGDIRLVHKAGGKSGEFRAHDAKPPKAKPSK